jgi:hypothetical protein
VICRDARLDAAAKELLGMEVKYRSDSETIKKAVKEKQMTPLALK